MNQDVSGRRRELPGVRHEGAHPRSLLRRTGRPDRTTPILRHQSAAPWRPRLPIMTERNHASPCRISDIRPLSPFADICTMSSNDDKPYRRYERTAPPSAWRDAACSSERPSIWSRHPRPSAAARLEPAGTRGEGRRQPPVGERGREGEGSNRDRARAAGARRLGRHPVAGPRRPDARRRRRPRHRGDRRRRNRGRRARQG